MQDNIGPQRAAPKSLAAIKAEIKQQDCYMMPKPEEITIYEDSNRGPSNIHSYESLGKGEYCVRIQDGSGMSYFRRVL